MPDLPWQISEKWLTLNGEELTNYLRDIRKLSIHQAIALLEKWLINPENRELTSYFLEQKLSPAQSRHLTKHWILYAKQLTI